MVPARPNPSIPRAILFACGHNAIRSPMAAALMRHFYGHSTYVASCGVKGGGEVNPFAVEVMEEMGIDLSQHVPQAFDDLYDSSFDLVVSLSPEAHHRAMEMTRTMAIEAEYWPTEDPSLTNGNRDQVLGAYQRVRDKLMATLEHHFLANAPPNA